MIHVDEVLALFEEHYPEADIDVSVDKVEAVLTSGALKVKVTFIEKQQVFNFDSGRGKTYTASNFEALKSNIETFFYMENDFKPKSQAICSVFKNLYLKGQGVVITGIRGGNNQNFTAIYSISGSNEEVVIKAIEPNVFEVTYQDNVFIYIMDECGNINPVITVNNYSEELHKRYADSTFVSIARTGMNSFSFKYDDGLVIDITASLTEDYKIEVSVDRIEYNGNELQTEIGVVELENIYDLAELYTNFDYLIEEQPTYTEELNTLMAKALESVLEDSPSDDSNSDELFESKDTVEEVEEPVDEFTTEVGESPAVDDFSIVLIVGLDNKPNRVRFIMPERFLDMDISIAEELGIPINLIIASEQLKIKRGMLLTDMELNRRIFAVDVSSDKTLCSNLVDKLFS